MFEQSIEHVHSILFLHETDVFPAWPVHNNHSKFYVLSSPRALLMLKPFGEAKVGQKMAVL